MKLQEVFSSFSSLYVTLSCILSHSTLYTVAPINLSDQPVTEPIRQLIGNSSADLGKNLVEGLLCSGSIGL